MFTETVRDLETSKTGLPCLWESGGGATNTGDARLIADARCAPKKALYVRRSGSLACGDHALIPVAPGDVVAEFRHHRRDFTIALWRIDAIEGGEARLSLLAAFDRGEWSPALPQAAEELVETGMAKATDYHCREPYYILSAPPPAL